MATQMRTGAWQVYAQRQGKAARTPTILGRLKSGRPIVLNPDGSVSTHRNIVVNLDGRSYLLPTLYGGRQVSEQQAVALLRQSQGIDPDTGQPFPQFDTDEEALAYEQEQHKVLEAEVAPYLPKKRGR
jgi:hypothetical protein